MRFAIFKFLVTLFAVFLSLTAPVLSGELEDRAKINRKVQQLIATRKFSELDALAKQFREHEERTSSGLWKITLFYAAFNESIQTYNDNKKYWIWLKSITDDYVEHDPQSPTAIIVKGIYLTQLALNSRGEKVDGKYPLGTKFRFARNLKVANDYLLDNKSIAKIDPHWYATRAKSLRILDHDTDEFLSNMTEGLNAFPGYYQLYFDSMTKIKRDADKSKFRRDAGAYKIEEFAIKAAQKTKGIEGMGLYTRIYWYAAQSQYHKFDLFEMSPVNWEKMKEGIFDILAKYPDEWNKQNFAFFACLKGDAATTNRLFKQIYSEPILSVWTQKEVFEYCENLSG